MSNSLLTIQSITNEALRIFEDELLFGGSPWGLDRYILKICDDTEKLTKALRMMMHMEQQELALNNVWRLEITDNGSYKLNDFTLPTNDVIINKMHTKDKVPKWMLESLAVLQILDNGESIADVGKKIDESIFYLLEPKD
jgi:hypothetical protein